MSVTVPDCMWARPWRLRPTPRTVPQPCSSISKTSALANSVPMSSAVQAARADSSSRPQILRQNATAAPLAVALSLPAVLSVSAIAARAEPIPSRRVPMPWAISGRPPPRPSMGFIATLTSSPAEMPRSTRSGLTVTKICGASASHGDGDDAATQGRPDVLDEALPLLGRLERARVGDELDARRHLLAPARPVRPALGRPAPPARSRRRVSRSSSWRAATRSGGRVDRRGADRLGDPIQQRQAARAAARPRRRRSRPRCAGSRRRCSDRR